MTSKLLALFARLEALSAREQVLIVAGTPLVVMLICEGLIFSPARARAAEANKIAVTQEAELRVLNALLAAQPPADAVPAIDQLQRQREALLSQIDAARAVMTRVDRNVDWGTVVRDTLKGTQGLALTSLKAAPPEVIFEPTKVVPVAAPQGKPAAAPPRTGAASAPPPPRPAPGAGDLPVYRHRAELTVSGDVGTLLGYLQSLQRLPGDLSWDRVQLNAAVFPQATVQMTLFTMSTRPETPFN